MSTQRSHFAYRLAWENSFSERIPFLPLHRRDLVSAEEGNKTFVAENKSRINWKKFEVMGEVVLGIQRSQKSPHPQAQKFDDVERLILESKLSGDEEVTSSCHTNRLTCILTSPRTYMRAAYMSNRPREQKDEGSLDGCVRSLTQENQSATRTASLLPPPITSYSTSLMPPRPSMIDKTLFMYFCLLFVVDSALFLRPRYAWSSSKKKLRYDIL